MARPKIKAKRGGEKIRPLTNYDIQNLVLKMKIPYFEGIYMRDTLQLKGKPKVRECWILNHGTSQTDGTHWTALVKNHHTAFYFDSFGNLPPPLEVIDYLNGTKTQLYYNIRKYQGFDTVICGHLCVKFLFTFWSSLKNI